jgi:glyoxylase-like metal-dependent hydrolase (beta-lactamase superfamily II)
LIDTGVGPADSAFGRWLGVGGTLPDELAALGVMPDDVDDVILTHVHSDHTGVEHDAVVERMGPAVLECPVPPP